MKGCIQSVFQDIESALRTGRVPKDDIELVLEFYISNFITYEIPPGIYTVGDLSDYVTKFSSGNFRITYDEISRKTKLSVGSMLRLDEKDSFNILLGFTPNWD